jgi:hypothetical protein
VCRLSRGLEPTEMQLMGRALLRGVWAERVSGRSRPVLHGKRQNIGKDKSIAAASTEMLSAKRHAGVHTPVIAWKMIIANQQMAYAA